jgi:hypothetical protein
MLATLLAFLALSPAAPAPRVIDYRIEGPAEFRATVQDTLADPRGWSLGGAVRFREVRSGGRFAVRLVPPATVASYPSCSEFYSCRSGENVLVNERRWRDGALSYADLEEYRRHVINHEVGHALGFGHSACAADGAWAAVMQQQSKGLDGCRARPWPMPAERRALAERLDVQPQPPRAERLPLSAFWLP